MNKWRLSYNILYVKSVVLLPKQEETNHYLYILVDLDYVAVAK